MEMTMASMTQRTTDQVQEFAKAIRHEAKAFSQLGLAKKLGKQLADDAADLARSACSFTLHDNVASAIVKIADTLADHRSDRNDAVALRINPLRDGIVKLLLAREALDGQHPGISPGACVEIAAEYLADYRRRTDDLARAA
jgi:hypothetical protein